MEPFCGRTVCAKPGRTLDDADRGDTAHHGGRAVPILTLHPAIERLHQRLKLNARRPALNFRRLHEQIP